MADEQWDMLALEQGVLAVVVRHGRLCRVCFESSVEGVSAAIASFYPAAQRAAHPLVKKALGQLADYFLGKRSSFDLPLDDHGLSTFARAVHRELVKVPYGTVISYAELAGRVGSPRAARAVGSVMATNPFPLLVPCHRVVNADGRIGRYSAADGCRTKTWLIDFERRLADA